VVHALSVHLEHVEKEHNDQAEEVVHKGKSFGSSRHDVQQKYYEQREIVGLKLLVLLGDFHRCGVVLFDLVRLHVNDILVKLNRAVLLLHFPLWRSFLLSPLPLTIRFTSFILLDRVDPIFDQVDDREDDEG
jgi:hypothetical protein